MEEHITKEDVSVEIVELSTEDTVAQSMVETTTILGTIHILRKHF